MRRICEDGLTLYNAAKMRIERYQFRGAQIARHSNFKTAKYRLDYPARFETMEAARAWMRRFVAWYNAEHSTAASPTWTPPTSTPAPPP